MKILGQGWQYTTYDLGNGRVLKKYHSWLRGYWLIFLDQLRYPDGSVWKVPAFYKGCKKKAIYSLKLVAKGALEPWMMGNPKILSETDFEQDKVTPLDEFIQVTNAEEGKEIVDKFVAFNKILLERGVIDKSFNITKNFGITSDKRVILIDLGELYDDPVKIKEQIQKRAWASRYVAEVIKNPEIRKYYVDEMDKNFGTVA